MRYHLLTFALLLPIIRPSASCALQCETINFQKNIYAVCHVDVETDDLRLFWRRTDGSPLESIAALRQWNDSLGFKVLFATNSGIYDKNRKPLGLHVAEHQILVRVNRKKGEGNFFLEPNGIFAVDDAGAAIWSTEEFAEQPPPRFAAQSGPLLVRQGTFHPAFKHQSSNRLIRNGVGVKTNREIYFVESKNPVNFFELASFFRDHLSCNDALYLDGVISQMTAPGIPMSKDSPAPLVGMWAVVESTTTPSPLSRASQGYKEKKDFKNLQTIHNHLRIGMTRTEVEQLLGQKPDHSATEGQYVYICVDQKGPSHGNHPPPPLGLIVDYRDKNGTLTNQLQSFSIEPISE